MTRLFTLFTFLLPLLILAQNKSGVVTYEEKMNLHKRMQVSDPAILEMVPEFRTTQRILLFSPDESVYREPTGEEKEEEFSHEGEGRNVTMVIRSPKNETYRNLEEQTSTEMREFMGRVFLINGKMEKRDWKITGEQEQVAGFMCMKAKSVFNDTMMLEAWFSPQIPVSLGPGNYGDLPGLILKVALNEDEQIIKATKVELKEVSDDAIQAPTEGKKVTREKFEKIVEEKTKEMMESSSGSGGIRIIRN